MGIWEVSGCACKCPARGQHSAGRWSPHGVVEDMKAIQTPLGKCHLIHSRTQAKEKCRHCCPRRKEIPSPYSTQFLRAPAPKVLLGPVLRFRGLCLYTDGFRRAHTNCLGLQQQLPEGSESHCGSQQHWGGARPACSFCLMLRPFRRFS